MARSDKITPPGTSATYTGSTRVSAVRARTGARVDLRGRLRPDRPGLRRQRQSFPHCRRRPSGGLPQCSSTARPSRDCQATVAGPGMGITVGSVIRARSASAVHCSGVAALIASVKYTPASA